MHCIPDCGRRFPGSLALAAVLVALGPQSATAHHPHDPINAFFVSPAYDADGTLFVASNGSMNVFVGSTDRGRTWAEHRLGFFGHGVQALAAAPDWATSGRAYAISREGALQMSTDRGLSWDPPWYRRGMLHLEVLPGAEGAGLLIFSSADVLYEASAVGDSVTVVGKIPPSKEFTIECIGASPLYEEDRTLAVGLSDSTVALSADGGSSWNMVGLGALPKAIRFSPDYPTDATLWIATWGGGVLRSINGGTSFEPLNEGLGDLYVNDLTLAPTYPAPPDLFVATETAGVLRSADAGASWFDSGLEIVKTDQTSNHFRQVRLSPQYPDDPSIFVGTFEGFYWSEDDGTSWRQANLNPTRISRLLAISPSFDSDGIVVGAGYGMHLLFSADHGDTWDLRFTDFHAISAYSLAVSPNYANDSLVVSGTGAGIRLTRDQGRSYTEVRLAAYDSTSIEYNSIRSVAFSPDFANDQTLMAVANGGFYRSTDAGLSWDASQPPTRRTWKLAVSPEFPSDSLLLAGGPDEDGGLWRSRDGGRAWEELGGITSAIYDIRISPDFAADQTAFLVTGLDGVLRSTDQGDTWVSANDGLGAAFPSHLALSTGFGQNGTGVLTTEGHGVFETTDSGSSWHRLSPISAPVTNGQCLLIAPDYPADPTLFVGTWAGLYRSSDRGLSWEKKTRFELYDDRRQEPWVMSGTWRRDSDLSPAINQGVAWSQEVGASAMLPMVGTGGRVIGTLGPDRGEAVIRIDGAHTTVVDLYSPVVATQQTLLEWDGLSNRYHELTIQVRGKKSPNSTGYGIQIDAVEVRFP
jgi:photosystem II stability/assembly factor-like uncharacterized protein